MKENLLRRLCVVILCCSALSTTAVAVDATPTPQAQQSSKINGIIKDSKGDPVIGASVIVKGTNTGVATDLNGRYSISARPDDILVINYVGMKNKEVKASEAGNIVMTDDAAQLDEVVVLGYGAAQKKQDLSASVGVVRDTEKLSQRPVASTEGMLQGQLAGVTVQATSGDPTATPSLVIRGQGSKNGDNVLWVVDGVPGAPIPSTYDIESIVVLKDAASAAIYGATSGAGGCVLVTTKRAKQTNGAQLTYETTLGVRQATNLIHGLSATEEIEMRKISYENAGMPVPTGWSGNSGNADFDKYLKTQRTDWTDEIFRSAVYQRHNLGINFGNEVAQNRISFAYDDDNGVLANTYKKSTNLHYTGSFNINKWLRIDEDFNWRNQRSRGVDFTSAYTGVVLAAIYMPQSAAAYDQNGHYGGTVAPEFVDFASIHGDCVNPLRLLEADRIYDRNSNTYTTTSLTIQNILPGLKFTSRFSYFLDQSYYKNFTPIRDEIGKPVLTNSLYEASSRGSNWKTENTLTYDNSFGKHTVGALLSTTANKYYARGLNVTGNNFNDESPYLQYLAYAGSLSSYGDFLTGPDFNVAYVGRVSYSFDDRYFATASLRRDYASRLPENKNYGDFPAVTAAWKISNESFFPKSETVNLLKLRASWGRVGNLGSIGYNYKAATLATDVWNEQAFYGPGAGMAYGTFIYPDKALNPDLTWETSEQWDLGLDLAMFDSRLDLSIDYFNKRTFDLIQEQTTGWPNTIGTSARFVNQGEIKNTGLEIQAGWHDTIGKDLSYSITGNFAYLHNEIKSTGIVNEDGSDGVWTGGGEWRNMPWCYRSHAGGPLNEFYIVKTNGVIKNDAQLAEAKKAQPNAQLGDLFFIDYDKNGTIDERDRQYCGSATPKYTFALSGAINYKKLFASMMLQGVAGAQAYYVGKSMILSDVEGNFNRSSEILNAWSPSNPDSDIPRLSKNDPNGNWSLASDYFLEDASYIRLKNLTIGYDFSDLLRRCAHFADRKSSISAYISGENLFTITKYSGMDPECGGYDQLRYPVSRVLSFGVKITY